MMQKIVKTKSGKPEKGFQKKNYLNVIGFLT